MKEVFAKNARVPGVSLEKGPNSTELCLSRDDGCGRMTFYALFPGLYLAYIDIHAPAWPIPESAQGHGLCLLNYCSAGRCELLLDNGSFLYVEQGDLSISGSMAKNQFVFPRKHYEGIEFYLDADRLKNDARFLKEQFDLDPVRTMQTYCGGGETYLAKPGAETARLLEDLRNLRKSPSLFSVRLLTLELLHRLADKKPQPGTRSFYTGIQVRIAKKAEEILTSDLRRRYPVRELAQRFRVSETSLKNYFRGVYGQNISVYLRELRMREAARLLSETELPVSEVSERVGYENQGKFAAVFKARFGTPPLSYRRRKALEKAT